jgi:hypothetical protein
MGQVTDSALGHLARETGAVTSEEIRRLVGAVKTTSKEFPDYFIENPTTKIDKLKREIFVLRATIVYMESHVPQQHIDRLKNGLYDLRMKLGRLH